MNLETTHIYNTSELLELYDKAFDGIQFSEQNDQTYRAVYYFLSLKGKRIRPLLLMHANQMFGGDVEQTLSPAFGVELFHNFTLVHDDIMDEADIRRGFPTVHKKFNEGTAILAGDLMFILSYKFLSGVDTDILRDSFELFNSTATQIIEGQQMDGDFENRLEVEEEEYIKMIEFKTSVLLAASLKLGAKLARASEQNQELIYEFGRNLGLAFQIKDDWLDVYGDAKLGKRIGGDIVQNKKTYLYIKALKKANEDQKKQLVALQNESDENLKIEKTIQIYNELNINKDAEELMNGFYAKAIDCFEQIDLIESQKVALRNFSEKIYNRDY
ncbi:MAG: polyprenyl synthetase family protein [Bacteroidota bacterium]